MSEYYVTAIPTDPLWVPGDAQEAAARAVFDDLLSPYRQLEVSRRDRVDMVDAGEEFETVSCPACGFVLGDTKDTASMRWFGEEVHAHWTDNRGFWPLDIVAPCCGATTSLNDLIYQGPQGFASWLIRANRPNRYELDDDQRRRLEAALGHPIRLVSSHY